jgi:hypothetical protein
MPSWNELLPPSSLDVHQEDESISKELELLIITFYLSLQPSCQFLLNGIHFCEHFWVRSGQVTTDGQSVGLSWCPDISYVMKVTVLSIGGALSDERSGLSFVIV